MTPLSQHNKNLINKSLVAYSVEFKFKVAWLRLKEFRGRLVTCLGGLPESGLEWGFQRSFYPMFCFQAIIF